jgi:hypothetical protein
MDEWGDIGTFPVVIYGYRGKLVIVHNIKSLILEDDVNNIKVTVGSFWWDEDSISFFGPDEEYFFIRLHWGRMLVFELSTGRLITNSDGIEKEKWEKLQSYAERKIEETALLKLNSQTPEERKTGCIVVGQLMVKKAIPRLRELLNDESYILVLEEGRSPGVRAFYVRKAAKEALEAMGEKVGDIAIQMKETDNVKYDNE